MSLEQRVQYLEHRFALQDLVVDYFVATDADDFDTLATCFADDAVFEAGGFVGGTSRDAIIAFLREARSAMQGSLHTFDYQRVYFGDAGTARGIVGAHLEIAMAGQTLYGAVRYEDQYRYEAGAWRIAHRHMRTFHMGPWHEVQDSLNRPDRVRWPGTEPQPGDPISGYR